jgi:hypothetical protein
MCLTVLVSFILVPVQRVAAAVPSAALRMQCLPSHQQLHLFFSRSQPTWLTCSAGRNLVSKVGALFNQPPPAFVSACAE